MRSHRLEKVWQTKAGLMAVCAVMEGEKDGVKFDSHRCGYVAVGYKHRAWGAKYDDIDAGAHGGLTYNSDVGGESYPTQHEWAWWFGFDCNHLGDSQIENPYDWPTFDERGSIVRSKTFVELECEKLAVELMQKDLIVRRYIWNGEEWRDLWKKKIYNWSVGLRWALRSVIGRPIFTRRD